MSEEVKELLVRVSATTELLRSNLIQAERAVAQFEGTTNAATQRIDNSFNKVGKSAAAQQAGIKQLGQQFGDLSLQLGSAASSAKPAQMALMAFAQQGGQIAYALDLASGGTSKFAAFLGGPWGIAITAGAAALGPLIQSLIDTAFNAEKATGALDGLIKKRQQNISEQNVVSDANADLDVKRNERSTILARIASRPKGPDGKAMFSYKDYARLDVLNSEISEGESSIIDELNRRRERTRNFVESKASAYGTTPDAKRGRTPRARTTAESPLTKEFNTLPSENSRDLYKAAEERMRILREGAADSWKEQSEQIRRGAEFEYEQRREVEDKLRSIRETQLQTLTGLYEDLFRGGTKAIWDDFAQIGQRVIAQVLAKFTLAKATGGSFDLGSALSASFTSVLGFADGGRPPLGRVSVVGERGPELFVPDTAGTVIPNHALGGGSSIVINAPGATAETVAMIRREIIAAAPMLTAAATGQTTRVMNRRRL